MNIQFLKPQEKYIGSYWEVFDKVAKERKYLGRFEGYPYDQTVAFIKSGMSENVPCIFALDSTTDMVIGWCDAQPKTEKVGYLGLGLLKEYRGNGIGKCLLCGLLIEAKKFGYEQIHLELRGSNVRAFELYKRVGFQYLQTIKNGFMFDGVVDDIMEMQINL